MACLHGLCMACQWTAPGMYSSSISLDSEHWPRLGKAAGHLLRVVVMVVVDVDSRCDATDDERNPTSNQIEPAEREHTKSMPWCWVRAHQNYAMLLGAFPNGEDLVRSPGQGMAVP